MDITGFFQQSAGQWFSQRTSHHLAAQQAESGQSTLTVELLAQDDPAVVQLCQQQGIDPALALLGSRITWDGAMAFQAGKGGSTLLVPLADATQSQAGTLLRQSANQAIAGRYSVNSDESVTLTTEQASLCAEERLWFASPNLRLRTNTLKQADGVSVTSFCSEIRKLPPKQA